MKEAQDNLIQFCSTLPANDILTTSVQHETSTEEMRVLNFF